MLTVILPDDAFRAQVANMHSLWIARASYVDCTPVIKALSWTYSALAMRATVAR